MNKIPFKSILITGAAGFVGSNLSLSFKKDFPDLQVIAFDNLKRRGSELNLSRFKKHGIQFFHGDIRCPEDFEQLPSFDLMIDCSAEPSVQAGLNGTPDYVIKTNLTGTLNCLELTRKNNASFIFLSTSRVYPIGKLNKLQFSEEDSRFEWLDEDTIPGYSNKGITEAFPLEGARSIYGASKLSGELMLQEYVYNYKMPAIINRCGVLTGPWQMGKVDQGVITLWVAKHYFKKSLKYIGYDGEGKQVRDVLHVNDLYTCLLMQIQKPNLWDGRIYNVGGGRDVSLSLLELTTLCQKITGHSIQIDKVPETSSVDLRIYLSDSTKALNEIGWKPKHSPESIINDIYHWIDKNKNLLKDIL